MTFEASMNAMSSVPHPQRTLTAFFDTRDDAQVAVDAVKAAGVADADVQLLEGADEFASPARTYHKETFWEALKHLFVPEDDRDTYVEGLRRGGFLVTVQADDANYQTISEILNREGTIDLQERANGWRADGWIASDGTPAGDNLGTQFDLPNAGRREADAGNQTISPVAPERAADQQVRGFSDPLRDRALDSGPLGERAVAMPAAPVVPEEFVDEVDTFRTEKIQDTIRRVEMDTDADRAARARADSADPTVKRAG